MKYKTLLAVDPAEKSGLAVFDIPTRQLIDSGVLRVLQRDHKTKKLLPNHIRRRAYMQEARAMIEEAQPDVVVVESGFVGDNPRDALLMEGRRWVWEQAALECGAEFGRRISPTEWQYSIGYRKGSDVKALSRRHVSFKYGDVLDMPSDPKKREVWLKQNQDACDAICIGEVAVWDYHVMSRAVG